MDKEIRGLVFDLQRFCTHDGPGIRSVVFLKGCPLRCQWCHNPESISPEPQLRFNRALCVDCGRCCSAESDWDPRQEYKDVLADKSGRYHRLSDVCPSGAWELIGRYMTVAEVCDEVESDRVYYESSGGGVTLSGGEAMLQFEFTLELLKELKRRGMHTAIETSGASSVARYLEVAEYVDLFLWDVKLLESEQHSKYIGGDMVSQLAALEAVLAAKADVALRCVYLKTIHDESHWEQVAAIYNANKRVLGVRVLPVHLLAVDKYRSINVEFPEKIKKYIPSNDEIKKVEALLIERGVTLTEY